MNNTRKRIVICEFLTARSEQTKTLCCHAIIRYSTSLARIRVSLNEAANRRLSMEISEDKLSYVGGKCE